MFLFQFSLDHIESYDLFVFPVVPSNLQVFKDLIKSIGWCLPKVSFLCKNGYLLLFCALCAICVDSNGWLKTVEDLRQAVNVNMSSVLQDYLKRKDKKKKLEKQRK